MSIEKGKVVGFVHSGYPEMRNFYGLHLESFKYKKQVLDPFKIADYAYFKALNKTNTFFHNSHFGVGRYDIFHLFNGISFGKKPWISTFETFIPRYQSGYKKFEKLAIKSLTSDNCKQIIALSENTRSHQLNFLSINYPDSKIEIEKKIIVIHPPQKRIITNYIEKELENRLSFTIVGSDFFRKGGKEVIAVFDALLTKNYNVKLNIVSSLKYGDYASQATNEDLKSVLSTIKKYPDNIKLYSYLDNKKVLDLLKVTHVALLPSYADTYGYFVLEAQACGCPVITTDIRAFPEINNDEVGYVISVPKNDLGNGIHSTKKEKEIYSSILKEGLRNIISQIYKNPKEIDVKGRACLTRIRENHNPADVSKIMNQIYLNSIVN